MKTTLSFLLLALFALHPNTSAADPGDPPKRVLAPVVFPDSFDDRSSSQGISQTDLGPAKFQELFARHNGMTLTVRQVTVPVRTWGAKTPKEILDEARDMTLLSDEALKLKTEKDFVIDGFPGRSILLARDSNKTVSRTDYFLLKPQMFIYTYSGPPAGLESADVAKFFKGIATVDPAVRPNPAPPPRAIPKPPTKPRK